MNRRFLVALCLFGGCKSLDKAAVQTLQAVAQPAGAAGALEHPFIQPPPEPRTPRRLTVDQLAASLPFVCGNDENGQPITWTVTSGGKDVAALVEGGLGAVLGKPDYVLTTDEPQDASALYVKLMDDMARNVCGKMVTADLARAQADRVLTKLAPIETVGTDAQISANLRYLSLRFLGLKVADTDNDGIADLRKLYDTVVAGTPKAADKSKEAWRAVCVGLLTSPEFHVN